VRWRHGQILDLGTVDGDACSRGRAINSKGQIVGGSSDCHNFLHAFVWEEGGPMLDLNTLIAPGSGLQLTNAFNINDRGVILAKSIPLGVTPIDDEDLGHVVLLIPCGAEDDCESENASGVKSSIRAQSPQVVSGLSKHNVPQRQKSLSLHGALKLLGSIDFRQLYRNRRDSRSGLRNIHLTFTSPCSF
jgi:probable HAF family extracellular repeat protein